MKMDLITTKETSLQNEESGLEAEVRENERDGMLGTRGEGGLVLLRLEMC